VCKRDHAATSSTFYHFRDSDPVHTPVVRDGVRLAYPSQAVVHGAILETDDRFQSSPGALAGRYQRVPRGRGQPHLVSILTRRSGRMLPTFDDAVRPR